MNSKNTLERIELIQFEIPYVHFFETSFSREYHKTGILVKAVSGDLCGYGEVVAETNPLYSYETTATAWLMLEEFLIPLLFRERLCEPEGFARSCRIYTGHPMAKAGLELALWDLKAKRAGLPLFQLYGGEKKEVLSGVSVGIQDSTDELLERIAAFLAEGYSRIKIKIKPGWDVAVCAEVRKAFPDIRLQVDANAAYGLADTDHLLGLDELGLEMVEQPFAGDDLWDHHLLQRKMRTALCLDESAKSEAVVRQALEMQSCRIINIKVGRVGGICEAKKIHDLCQKQGIPVWCGGMLETGIGRMHNIHLATLPNFALPNDLSASRRYFAEDIIDPEVDITERGTLLVPEGSGLGVTIREERIKEITIRRKSYSG
jgi:O-succinylbenzoate synthase